MDLAVEMRGISKYFNNKAALNDVNFAVEKGKIHCLLGENGAGKTTLMNILFGLYPSTSGEILIGGTPVDIKNTGVAFNLGLGMVHQHFMLIEDMTVLQNIILGNEIGDLKIDYSKNKSAVLEVVKEFDLEIDLESKIKDLSVGLKQRVEILKALYRGAKILVLDEPTAVLTPKESKVLMKILKTLREKGMTIIFITHKLYETMEVSDKVTILRNGENVGTYDTKDMSMEEIAVKMVGKKLPKPLTKETKINNENILVIKDLKLLNNAQNNINLEVKKGEILGIAGVDGNGQLEFEESLIGLRKITQGEILFENQVISNKNTIEIKEMGIGHIPSDRYDRAILPNMTLYENMLLGNQEDKRFLKKWAVDYDKLKKYSKEKFREFDVRYSDIFQNISGLSGGNQQKVIVSRETDSRIKVIIAAQPGRGLDIGAVQFIHDRFIEMRNQGKSIILISADLDEIIQMSDRIAVLYKGEIMAVDEAKNFDKESLGILMAGKRG